MAEEDNANDADVASIIKDYREDLEKRIVMCPFAAAKCIHSECNCSIRYCSNDKSILTALNKHEKEFHDGTGTTVEMKALLKQCRHDLSAAMKLRKRKWATEFATAARAENSAELIRQMVAPFVDEEPKECQECLNPNCDKLSHWEKKDKCAKPCNGKLKKARGKDGNPLECFYPKDWTYDSDRTNPSPLPFDLFERNEEAIREHFHWHMQDLVTAEMDRMERKAAKSAKAPNGGLANLAPAPPAVPPSHDTQVPAAVAPSHGSEHAPENAVSTRRDDATASERDSLAPKDSEAEPPQVVVSHSNQPNAAANDNSGPVSAEVAAQSVKDVRYLFYEEKVRKIRWSQYKENVALARDDFDDAMAQVGDQKKTIVRVQAGAAEAKHNVDQIQVQQAQLQAQQAQLQTQQAQLQTQLAKEQARLAQLETEAVDAENKLEEKKDWAAGMKAKMEEMDRARREISNRPALLSDELVAIFEAVINSNGASTTADVAERAAVLKVAIKKEKKELESLNDQVD